MFGPNMSYGMHVYTYVIGQYKLSHNHRARMVCIVKSR